jgi:hypothetical protein
MYEQSLKRPSNYSQLPLQEQWAIDKNLGILDWDGKDDRKRDANRLPLPIYGEEMN